MAVLLLLLLSCGRGASAQVPAASIVTPRTETSTGTISDVRVERVNVFDPSIPGEDWWIFRVANRIHFKTREDVVRRELLIGPSDRFSTIKALESERNLRNLSIFRRAEVKAEPGADGRTGLVVRTQDSWTTNVSFSAGTEGGEQFLTYGAAEDNLLGYGKALRFEHAQKGTKINNVVDYRDPRFLGSRFRLTPFYSTSRNGDSVGTEVVKPFFSLDSRDALGAYWTRTIDDFIVYRDGEEYSKFLLANRTASAGIGARLPDDLTVVQRFEVGWYSQRDQFHAEDDTVPGTLSVSRDLSGPVVGYSWVQPQYIKETDINLMERVEDFNLGNELSLYGGYMGRNLGGDRDRLIFNAVDQQGLFILPGRFALAQVGMVGRLANSRWENALFYTNLNLFWKTSWLYPQTWVSHLEANTGRNLDLENKIILGGNTGLRGYRNNSFVGGRSVLLNLEDRFFMPGEYFHLFRFGGAVFFDSGAVVPEGSGVSFTRFKSDVGAGLRMSSTRSQTGTVVRLDVAYALNQGPSGSRVVVSLLGRQAFQIFNSSTRNMRLSPRSRLSPSTFDADTAPASQ